MSATSSNMPLPNHDSIFMCRQVIRADYAGLQLFLSSYPLKTITSLDKKSFLAFSINAEQPPRHKQQGALG